ncbi:hypothetical protein [Aminipila terrae]|uniref:Uncharacterized protein n=1 Tax=Aminipila terrae TaxID=2697030 RepID=A0A6P1MAV6_9FIRM|nr:hypothetical protein [Aminipila terrae]QHI71760.1 hypothetical protein Ami3637_04590 [Aminipila terrae]
MANKKLDYLISDKYEKELLDIDYILEQLEKERVSELNGAKTDGSLSLYAKKLREEIVSLLCKIQTGEDEYNNECSLIN